MNFNINNLSEDKLINGGFLAVSIAIILKSLFKPASGLALLSVIICAVSIIPLAFNAFVIEYRRRFTVDVKHWGYELMVSVGFIASFLGFFTALAATNQFLAYAFILGYVVVLPCCLYLDKLVKRNKVPDKAN